MIEYLNLKDDRRNWFAREKFKLKLSLEPRAFVCVLFYRAALENVAGVSIEEVWLFNITIQLFTTDTVQDESAK